MLPSPAELEYFQEVASSLNISRAAERLGMSQPSLSLAIKRLEQSVGAPLFIRNKQGVLLTPVGKQLLIQVRQLIQYWEQTKSQVLSTQHEIQGHFTLGCNSIIAIYMIAAFLPDLLEAHPKLHIHLKHELSQKITEQVNNLSIDMGIVINPMQHPELIIRKIGDDKTCFWVGKGHRDIQNIDSKNLVLLCNPDSIQAQHLLKQCKKIGRVFQRMVTTDSLEVIANLTANGAGVGILPARVVTAMYPNDLQYIATLPTYSDELCLIYRSENRNIQAIKAITTSIISCMSKYSISSH